MEKRVWNSGPPPHVGWWNASNMKDCDTWRWWDGAKWSLAAYPHFTAEHAAREAAHATKAWRIEWTDHWPEGARVPRVDPRSNVAAPDEPLARLKKYEALATQIEWMRKRINELHVNLTGIVATINSLEGL